MGPEAAETATGWTPILRELVKKEKFIAVGLRKIRRLGKKYAFIKIPIKNIPLKKFPFVTKLLEDFPIINSKAKCIIIIKIILPIRPIIIRINYYKFFN